MGSTRKRTRRTVVVAATSAAVVGIAWWPRQAEQKVQSAGANAAEQATESPRSARPAITVNHYPTTLVAPGQPRILRYMVWCGLQAEGEDCDVKGTLHSRSSRSGEWASSPIVDTGKDTLGTGPWVADLPPSQATADLVEYYAEFTEVATSTTVLSPSGGAKAPMISRQLSSDVPTVDLASAEDVPAPKPFRSLGIGDGDLDLGYTVDGHQGASTIAVDGETAWLVDIVNDRFVSVDPDGKVAKLPVPGLRTRVGGEIVSAAVVKGRLYMASHHEIWRADLRDPSPAVERLAELSNPGSLGLGEVVADPGGDGVWVFGVERWLHVSERGDIVDDQPSRPSGAGQIATLGMLGGGMAIGMSDGRAWIVEDSASSQAPRPGSVTLVAPLGKGVLAVFGGSDGPRGCFKLVAIGTDGSSEEARVMKVWLTPQGVEHGLTRVALGDSSLFTFVDTETGTDLYRISLEALMNGAK